MADKQLIDVSYNEKTLSIEYQLLHPERIDRPLLVFLHEGLGSVAMWKDWPAKVCSVLQCRGLVFSRYGYGKSTPRPAQEKWLPDFMHHQAQQFMPAFFEALDIDTRRDRPILVGHSDGASIALLYAATFPDQIQALIVMAPHLFVEDATIQNIELAKSAYLSSDLPEKLARYHDNVDSAFWGWNDVWLSASFREWTIEDEVAQIRCPVLAIQGREDEYGSLAQIEGIAERAPDVQLYVIDDCRHSPHRDKPEQTTDAIAAFVRGLS
ncbi:alpha/beta hydrolase [Advenella kashmirensis W13003]|uniref:Alpha/beta hydrolase n=1 Tax=Advenella kashmirensis W13003 TaxID=1424334 RepID=V8QQL7_9BURK|nr:alpha/beta hydrolase [Advenella kashmirensis]ETF01289.1 alpha/beta hydrolase [Advenella kashmirensis W13003]